MIELDKKFSSNEKRITDYIIQRIEWYNASECKKKLAKRIERINNSLDMKSGYTGKNTSNNNTWKSKVMMPFLLEEDISLKALLLNSFSGNPMVSLTPRDDTPYENAVKAQKALESNFITTNFKNKALNVMRLYASHYGSCVVVGCPIRTYNSKSVTQQTPFGIVQQDVMQSKFNVYNTPVNLLNYGQNPEIPDPELSDFQYYIERVFFSDLIARYKENPDIYIKKNIEYVIKKGKDEQGEYENEMYTKAGTSKPEQRQGDFRSRFVDVVKYYGVINVKGNEDSNIEYIAEIAGDKIIKFIANPYDRAIRPIAVGGLAQRLDFWWRNSPIEYQFPYENLATLFSQMSADNALRRIEDYIFYEKGSIDASDWANRKKMGGLIPVDLKGKQAPHVLWNYQRPDISMQGTQYMLQEIKEMSQRVGLKSDLARQAVQGGVRNETATAANYLENRSNMIESDMLSQFSMAISQIGMINTTLIQQYSADEMIVRPEPKMAPERISKRDILGDFEYIAESSYQKTKNSEVLRLQNAIAGMLNFKGTGDPNFQRLDPIISKTVREWVRRLDLPSVDVDRDLLEQQMQQQIPMSQTSLPLPPPEMAGV